MTIILFSKSIFLYTTYKQSMDKEVPRVTMRQLRERASAAGFCCYWKVKKAELSDAVGKYDKYGTIPKSFVARKIRGESCKIPNECRSQKCVQNVCIGSKPPSGSRREKKEEEEFSAKPTPKKQSKASVKAQVKSSVKSQVKAQDKAQVKSQDKAQHKKHVPKSPIQCQTVCKTTCTKK